MSFKKEIRWLIVVFLVWRMGLLLVGFIAPHLIDFRSDFAYTKYSFYLNQPLSKVSQLVEPWANFDGVHYLNIARRGYVDEFRFFPLLPMSLKVISWGNIEWGLWASIISVQLLAFAAITMLYKLLRLDYSVSTSQMSILLLLTFPTSFFLGSIYTESLFLLLTVSAFYLARKEQWLGVGLLAVLTSATRIVGVALIPGLLAELWLQKPIKKLYVKIMMIISGVSGLLAYAYYLHTKFGNALLFVEGHTALGNSRSTSLVNPLRTVVRYGKILTSLSTSVHEWWVALLEICTFIFACALMYIAWRKNVRKSYLLYALFAFAVPVLSGTFTGLPRYAIILFPMFVALALIEKKWIKILYFCISVPLLIICTMLFVRGHFIA
jgi:hypothetical protein